LSYLSLSKQGKVTRRQAKPAFQRQRRNQFKI
jgi:hypothetical protein